MPALSNSRQPGAALDWFGSVAGQAVLAAEQAAVERLLVATPALPWAWLGVAAATPPERSGGRGVVLQRRATGFDGNLRCSVPLPLGSETFGLVMLQHVLDDGVDPAELLGECARVIAPGGVLWLAALNPWTPYRARWARTGLHAKDAGRWQAALRGAGFAVDSVRLQWLGPRWKANEVGLAGVGAADRLRAGLALTVNKRVHALIPPARLRNLQWQTGRSSLGVR